MVNIYQIFGKVLFKYKIFGTINDPLPVLPGSEQDLCQENIDLVNTYLFCQVSKVHDIVLETILPIYRVPYTLASDISVKNWCLNLIFVKDLGKF